ncbi:Importin 4 [Homalodisca vitripennis]|nr:Importin 4 [Homalodisca vitripennis]
MKSLLYDIGFKCSTLVRLQNKLQETRQILFLHKDDNNPTVGLFENLSDTEESEEDLGNTSDVSSDKDNSEDGFTVENAYLEEKEEAVIAVRELAQNCLEAFEPYVEICFQEIIRVVNYPHDDIRSAALGTVTQLCIHMHKVSPGGRNALQSALNMLIPKCAEVVRTDKEREVVITGLDTYLELLKEIGSPVLEGEGHTDAIINCVKDVLNCRTECQDEGDGEEGEEEAEGDELLIESAGEIIPHLGKVMPPLEFAQHYTQFLPMFVNLTKKQASDAQRSFGVGMIAECMACAGPCLPAYAQQLLSLLITLARDQNDEVRNNAIFALGELVYHGRDCIFPFYGEILQTLSHAVVNESNSGALDNICGALARLIITNVSGIPLEQVIPVFVRYLPLREDFEENKWVYQSLNNLYQMGSPPLLQNLNPVIKACAISLHGNQIETG